MQAAATADAVAPDFLAAACHGGAADISRCIEQGSAKRGGAFRPLLQSILPAGQRRGSASPIARQSQDLPVIIGRAC